MRKGAGYTILESFLANYYIFVKVFTRESFLLNTMYLLYCMGRREGGMLYTNIFSEDTPETEVSHLWSGAGQLVPSLQ